MYNKILMRQIGQGVWAECTLSGKGHEKYQEIKGVRHPFDDKEELVGAFELLDK